MAVPGLEDVRGLSEPAWLWDPLRLRIVWANAAGISYFGGETIFDLVDRPFDLAEPGVARIAAAARRLKHGEAERLALEFPSAGEAGPLACLVTPHVLADGRSGLLVAAEAVAPARADASTGLAAEAFDSLPIAALVLDAAGLVVRTNRTAAALVAGTGADWLGTLTGGPGPKQALLRRLGVSGTMSAVYRAQGRDLRLTLRTMGEDPQRSLALIEDVTERRALERSLSPSHCAPEPQAPPAPPREPPQERRLSAEEQAAFEALGATLNGEAALAAPRKPPPIPAFIREALDRSKAPTLYAQAGRVFHANPAALVLLGHDSVASLLGAIGEERLEAGDRLSLPAAGGGLRVAVSRSAMAWIGGPAERITLAPVATAVSDAEPAALEPAPIVAPPLPAEAPVPAAAGGDTASSLLLAHESELKAILDTAADGIVTLDREGQVKSFSAGAQAIFGRAEADVLGKTFSSLFAPEARKTVRDYFSALQGPGLASVFNDGREVTALEKNGGEVPLFLTITGLRRQQTSGAAFCAVVRDITQWKKTEQELREARDAAERASRQKSEFLAKISHELRTPLNAIMGFSEVMRLERFGEIANSKYRGYVNDIHDSGKHLLDLIDDLLDLSRVEAGKLELNFTSVALGDIIDYGLRMIQDQAALQRVILRKSVPAAVPNVVADLRSIRQIVLNLLSNAVKFTDEAGQVIISAAHTEAGEVKLRVKDTGIGMTPDQVRDALEPFRRVTTDGRDVPGTGLGLPLTKALAEANRAHFAISSEPRKGTLVEITFPPMRVLAG